MGLNVMREFLDEASIVEWLVPKVELADLSSRKAGFGGARHEALTAADRSEDIDTSEPSQDMCGLGHRERVG